MKSTTDTVENEQLEVAAAIRSKRKPASTYFVYGGGLLFVILLAFMAYKLAPAKSELVMNGQQRLVVLDSRKILASATKQIIENKNLSTEQVALVSQKLAANMQKVMAEYQAQGYLVINSSALLAWPKDSDITEQFADRLGVKIE